MKKVIVFFSDIVGTILGKSENSDEDYKKFNELLSMLKESEEADEIIFSLISTDNLEFVSNFHKTIDPFIGSTVTYGRQYFDKGYYKGNESSAKKTVGKADDISEYVKKLNQQYEVASVYYVDDVEMYHEILSVLAEIDGWDEELQSIIPTKNIGLSEVNELLQDNIKVRSRMQKKKC